MELFPFDDDYVRRLREGDRETATHFESYFRELLLIKLRRKLDSKQAIEDVRQEVFARVFAKLAELQDPRKLGSFVNSICNHVLMEWYRMESRSDAFAVTEVDQVTQSNIEDDLVTEETKARVRRVLGRMPARDANILKALFLEEGTKEEVCGRFGVDRKYLRVLLHRAKERFRSEFRRKSGRLQINETFLSDSSLLS
ncbi:MAG TPA: sigma-70 family RNA polymerase sigma factor [Thermoanaerobaculia bacterium]|nr:sigma-70 family RNA polymerase sigma factor [Thermoanaerobaculia bacterium]